MFSDWSSENDKEGLKVPVEHVQPDHFHPGVDLDICHIRTGKSQII